MKGEVEMQDKIVDIGDSKSGYFSLVETIKNYDDSFNSEDTYATINIKYDPKYYVYSREVYSLLEFLCDIGSLTQALMIIGYIIVGFITRRLYVAQLLKETYHTKVQRIDARTKFQEDENNDKQKINQKDDVQEVKESENLLMNKADV